MSDAYGGEGEPKMCKNHSTTRDLFISFRCFGLLHCRCTRNTTEEDTDLADDPRSAEAK